LLALAPRGDKLTAAMLASKEREAAGEWFGVTFAERLRKAGEKLKPLEANCGSDTELHAALGDAMAQFPMFRKKQP
jgi:hypothetical protein